MKVLNKNIFAALLALPMVAGLTSCTEEVDYSAAEVPTTAQVYFSKDDVKTISLTDGQSSFDVNVYRMDTSSDLTVPVSATDASGLFQLPSSVSFASGKSVATMTVTFDFDDLTPDTGYDIVFNLNEQTSEYGLSSTTLTVKYAPWSEWELFGDGTGTYTYTQFFSGDDPERPVYKRASLLNPTQAQFKVEGVMYGVDMIIDYDASTGSCKIAETYIGYDHASYGSVYIADAGTYWVDIRQSEEATYDMFPSSFNEETGLFSLYVAYYVGAGYFGYGYEYLQLDGYTQYDYSLTLSNAGHYLDPAGVDNAVVHILKGADVATYKCALFEGALNAAAVEQAAADIVAGTVEAEMVTESGYQAFPLDTDGKYTAVAVAFDADENVLSTASLTFEFMPVGMEDPWVSLGMCAYTEDCITTFFGVENLTYSVEVLEHSSKPGLYRLVNPYGAAYPYNEEGDYDTTQSYYLEIDAQDPEGVYINSSATGMNWGYGEITIWSYAGYYLENGYSLDEIKAAGYCGTLENGVITFPAESLLIGMAEYKDGTLYDANVNGAFKVDMTNLQSTSAATRAIAGSDRTMKTPTGAFKVARTRSIEGMRVDGKVFTEQCRQTVK